MNSRSIATIKRTVLKPAKYVFKSLGMIITLSILLMNHTYAKNSPSQNTAQQRQDQNKKKRSNEAHTTQKIPSIQCDQKEKAVFEFDDDGLFPEIKAIKDRGEIVVAMYYEDKAPFYFVNKDGKLVGNDPELAEEIAKAIDPNLKVRYIRTAQTFDETIQQVHQGQADIAISKLSYTIQRSKRVLYAKKPYTQLYNAFIVNRSVPSSLSLSELFSENSQYALCAIKGSSQVKIAQGLFPKVKLVELATAEDTVAALTSGKCIASIRDSNEIRKILFSNPRLNLRYKAVILNGEPDSIYIVTDPNKPKLAMFIDQLLENNPKNIRKLDDIFSKYEDQLR